MADKIRVNTGSLNTTRNNVSNQVKQIRAQVQAMRGALASLNSMWEGDAHAEFDSQVKADVTRLENLCKSLDGIVSYESNAITEYNNCERKVSELIASIKV